MIGRCVANRPYMYLPLKGDTNDYSVNNYTVTAVNSPSNTTGIFGESNGAISFNGSNQYLTFFGVPNSVTSGQITFSIYAKKTNATTWGAINNHRNNSADNLSNDRKNLFMFMNASGNFEFINKGSSDGAQIIKTGQSYLAGQWYHIVLTTNGNSHKFYLDGSLISSYNTTTSGSLELTDGVWQQLARHYYTPGNTSGNSYFGGSLSDFRFIAKALTDGQIKILNSQKGRISLPKKLLLDTYSGASVAYSVRKLRYNYNGSAIRVRRSSDNAEQDIGFIANQLDIASLESFCSGTNGFVVTWYDQSGNGRNATQSTTANQPKIYDSSTGVLTENSEPTMVFDGTDYFEITDFNYGSYANLYANIVCKPTDNTNRNYVFGHYLTTGNQRSWVLAFEYTVNSQKIFVNVSSDGNTTPNFKTFVSNSAWTVAQQLVELQFTTNDIDLWVDGSSETGSYSPNGTVNTIHNSTGNLAIGRILGGSLHFIGNLQECMFWSADQNSNRSGIASNINSHYGIY